MPLLAHNEYELVIAPELGGSILSFKCNGQSILREARCEAVQVTPEASACFPCVPYFGRLYDGLLPDGSRTPLSPTISSSPLPLHGEGWVSKWRCAFRTTHQAIIRMDHVDVDAGLYPFRYRAEQRFSLNNLGLDLTLTVTNTDNRPMPCGLGLHPYFSRTPAHKVQFCAAQEWHLPGNQTRGRLSALQGNLGGGNLSALPDWNADLSFAGFDGEVLIQSSGLDIRLKTDAPLLHLYAPERSDFFCLEPITHAPGLLMEKHCSLSGQMLMPGQSSSIKLSISAQLS